MLPSSLLSRQSFIPSHRYSNGIQRLVFSHLNSVSVQFFTKLSLQFFSSLSSSQSGTPSHRSILLKEKDKKLIFEDHTQPKFFIENLFLMSSCGSLNFE
jgi:hypothetical protein